ncbi:MAG: ribonuclease Y [Candidatus Abawacabacteria bacterium RIFCSPHIGHO2_01_FULL_46_8]|uniref:Ribonuclease Y n=1 Tax=Candidatus Abawacabacteria bacterium RIFCSPHIGHO2_01_FULL_46_8 TaxID=1817815 RepID=A0A1F4XMN7_9BACT|nr:MAG: ribonuclease Y [Candidatus Abawacabacteria bacterium RIFCSPHIGHO2_01_FULL_46_8]
MSTIVFLLLLVIAAAAAFAVGFSWQRLIGKKAFEAKAEETHRLLDKAKAKVREAELEAKDKAIKILEEAKREETNTRRKLDEADERLVKKENTLDERTRQLDQAREQFTHQQKDLNHKQTDLDKMIAEEQIKLSEIAKLSPEKAKEQVLKHAEREAAEDIEHLVRKIEAEAKEEAEKRARKVIGHAIQKYAGDVVSEATITVVQLPNDEMKGRIIGREGRNINAFERAAGVDVIVDDSPSAVLISGFDLVRREIAKRAMEELVEDGRIQPARIEEIIEKARKEVNTLMKEMGEKAVYGMGITGLHPDLIKIIGRLHFRTSYGQNVLQHSIEVGYLCAAMAEEIGADTEIAKKAGFLHDIGKAVDHEITGTHPLLGRDIAKKYGLPPEIIHAIEAHHQDVEQKTVEAMLVQVADAISGGRPGARSEALESYIKRLKELEAVADGFAGVEKSYAIQAGREVRVIVKPGEIDDLEANKLAKDIAKKIEENLQYPGQIKVNVIREQRVIEYAR